MYFNNETVSSSVSLNQDSRTIFQIWLNGISKIRVRFKIREQFASHRYHNQYSWHAVVISERNALQNAKTIIKHTISIPAVIWYEHTMWKFFLILGRVSPKQWKLLKSRTLLSFSVKQSTQNTKKWYRCLLVVSWPLQTVKIYVDQDCDSEVRIYVDQDCDSEVLMNSSGARCLKRAFGNRIEGLLDQKYVTNEPTPILKI